MPYCPRSKSSVTRGHQHSPAPSTSTARAPALPPQPPTTAPTSPPAQASSTRARPSPMPIPHLPAVSPASTPHATDPTPAPPNRPSYSAVVNRRRAPPPPLKLVPRSPAPALSSASTSSLSRPSSRASSGSTRPTSPGSACKDSENGDAETAGQKTARARAPWAADTNAASRASTPFAPRADAATSFTPSPWAALFSGVPSPWTPLSLLDDPPFTHSPRSHPADAALSADVDPDDVLRFCVPDDYVDAERTGPDRPWAAALEDGLYTTAIAAHLARHARTLPAYDTALSVAAARARTRATHLAGQIALFRAWSPTALRRLAHDLVASAAADPYAAADFASQVAVRFREAYADSSAALFTRALADAALRAFTSNPSPPLSTFLGTLLALNLLPHRLFFTALAHSPPRVAYALVLAAGPAIVEGRSRVEAVRRVGPVVSLARAGHFTRMPITASWTADDATLFTDPTIKMPADTRALFATLYLAFDALLRPHALPHCRLRGKSQRGILPRRIDFS
ncbi:hypothetical protein K488DRAFT_87318 [Vararia minispora EC-137]|uniref:Uncharacterized protein n=1 Tax=Vararia minispora EC-137 TaxID=1314806 RepID=A0ACB8QH57_9AGAM|nr:hypothetical protein K488DRAFT_87318 [Vararia minispora EC-137]